MVYHFTTIYRNEPASTEKKNKVLTNMILFFVFVYIKSVGNSYLKVVQIQFEYKYIEMNLLPIGIRFGIEPR